MLNPSSRILLVEDSRPEREALAAMLREEGYEVDEAEDGESTLLMLESRRPDLLLLDLKLHGADGFSVLKQLQQEQSDLPVIIMTGLDVNEIQRSMGRLPVHELPTLLLKPIDVRQMLNLVALRLSGELPGGATGAAEE